MMDDINIAGIKIYFGTVEKTDFPDPLELGREKVRVFGIHNPSKEVISTNDLPWAVVMQPTTSSALPTSGITPRLLEGSRVIVIFLDGEYLQVPMIIGTIPFINVGSNIQINGATAESSNIQNNLGQSTLPINSRSGSTDSIRESVQINNVAGAFQEPEDLRPNRRYPYNQVRQSEAGHIEEWDNTPGNERILTQHSSGTFTEIRPDGSSVTKVLKDSYEIVAGEKNVYVSGSVNVIVQGNANLTVEGDYNVNVGGDYNLRVQGSMFEHVNLDKTSLINGNSNSYVVGSSNKTVGMDDSSTIVGSEYKDIYKDKTTNTYGNVTDNTFGTKTTSVTGSLNISSKSSTSILSNNEMELGTSSSMFIRGSTAEILDQSATSVNFDNLDSNDQIEVYDLDFESIEVDITVIPGNSDAKSTVSGVTDSETFRESTRSRSWSDQTGIGNMTRTLNGTTESSRSATAPDFLSNEEAISNFENVKYNYAAGTRRDGRVNVNLESILSATARATGIDIVEIHSGLQPGSRGLRIGSGRHDTGEAADIKLIKNGSYVSGYTTEGREIISSFMREAVRNGIRGAGFSRAYMGDFSIHVDTLGQIVNSSNSRSASSYDRNVLAVWRSEEWFKEVVRSADPSYQYFLVLASGTSCYSRTNSNWSRIA